MKVWVVIRIMALGVTDDLTLDPVGIYSNEDIALEWVEKLNNLNTDPRSVVFDVIDFDINDKPIILDIMQTLHQEALDAKSEYMADMMKRGYVDQLVGEDGEFYYKITPKGKNAVERSLKIKKLLQDFFDSKKF